jgi:S1-C subfamily serine protease
LLKIIYTLLLLSLALDASSEVENSIVKIYKVSKNPDYQTPWNSTISRSHGSGSIIGKNRILTNAHVVANETFLEVRRDGDTKRYEAEVEFISHQADLALLSVKDKEFFKGTKPLKLDGLPSFEQSITVYGFPMGGDSLSVSRGVVSRIEHGRYVHSGEIFLSIQIDAAINPGNSGGPAIYKDKIVGVVMQQIRKSQSIGYLVPVEIIKHFLDDVSDGRYDGFSHLGITTQKMENQAMRDIYKMDDDTTGILVVDISQKSNAYKYLKPGDILLSLDSNKIQNNGSVELSENKYTSYKYFIDKKQIGDNVTFKILRDGVKKNLKISLNNIANDNLLVNTLEHDTMPRYYIYGGYVFSPLSRNLLQNNRSTLLQLRKASNEWASDEKEEVVVLLKVLADEINRGDHGFSLWRVDMVNSKKFKNFKEFVNLFENSESKYMILENEDGIKMAIDRQKALKTKESILDRYSINNHKKL